MIDIEQILIVGFLLVFVFALLHLDRYTLARAAGASMEPTFGDGAVLLVDTYDDPGMGDVVCFDREANHVCHRVVEALDGCVVVGGDNEKTNPEPDPGCVPLDDIHGSVVEVLS